MSEVFAVGQRYLSDAESGLGLGVVVEVDARSVQVLFPQSEETRVYAKNAQAISRVVFGAGDAIVDQDGNRHTVAAVEEIEGVLRYRLTCGKSLMETRLAANISLDKPLQRLLAGRIDRNEWFDLRVDAAALREAFDRHPLRGLMGARVDAIAHQLYIAHEVGKRMRPRVLLADEVGLGKTVEAGLILHSQFLTGKIERALILVPDSLQYQWAIELKRRFNLDFALFDLVRTAAIKEHNPDQNVFLSEQRIIASVDLLADHPDLFEQAYTAGFDMLVVDEAHHLHWDAEQGGNDRYEAVEALAQTTKGLLLLTATPEQLGEESHFARLRLLDPDRFDDLASFIDEQEDFALLAQIVGALLSDAPLSQKQIAAVAGLLGCSADRLQNLQHDPDLKNQTVNELLDRHGTGRVLFRNTRDSVGGFLGRKARPYPLPMPKAWQDGDRAKGSLKDQLWGEESCPPEEWLFVDPRVSWLVDILKGDLKRKKTLLIARSGAVVQSLEETLRARFGIKTAIFVEEMSLLERDQAAAYFASEGGAQILLCSEIGSEGRNFQFAHDLILFDLPANPDTLEQRIGRLDRIGQTRSIEVHVPFLQGGAQERLYRWYDEALGIFCQISPCAQAVQEAFVADLKPLLLACPDDQDFDALIQEAAALRRQLEAHLQQGRDRLLEYNSCRPRVAQRIKEATERLDCADVLPQFLGRLLDTLNIDYSVQRDGSWAVHPLDGNHFGDELLAGALGEEGIGFCFDRATALTRFDLEYMTHEHPFMQTLHESMRTQGFGNAAVALLKSAALPPGMLMLEVYFRLEAIAPKVLNVNAFLLCQRLRVFVSENGDDLSELASAAKIAPLVEKLDKQKALHAIKRRAQSISQSYKTAQSLAAAKIDDLSAQAQTQFAAYYDREIERLLYLKNVNPSVRQDEIDLLISQKAQGVAALQSLALTPDCVRVLVAVRP